MLRKIRIQNYKSILDDTLELGRLNVFIGENGCGKTNILEALAMTAQALAGDLTADALSNRGIRLARPSLTLSAFTGLTPPTAIEITIGEWSEAIRIVSKGKKHSLSNDPWKVVSRLAAFVQAKRRLTELAATLESNEENRGALVDWLNRSFLTEEVAFKMNEAEVEALADELDSFAIYAVHSPALRGFQSDSKRVPLGIYGEGLDTAIAALDEAQRAELAERAGCISWFKKLDLDEDDRLKLQGFKLGRSTSALYFMDKFMPAENNVFSAENANEGILHVLFYLTLFLSKQTPKIFAIDNIESALNPQLCRELIKELAQLAAQGDKQAFITTHNPAILDGLNLHDDEQRLFVVSRDDEGHTVTDRIRLKPETAAGEPRFKLSELWMRGMIGGLPERF
jgi:hypothetical protein